MNLKRMVSPSMAVACTALFVALGGGSYAAAHGGGSSQHHRYVPAKRVATLDGKGAGEFDQVGSASDSTELAADGQEVDVFYNDGVNWRRSAPRRRTAALPGSPASAAEPIRCAPRAQARGL